MGQSTFQSWAIAFDNDVFQSHRLTATIYVCSTVLFRFTTKS